MSVMRCEDEDGDLWGCGRWGGDEKMVSEVDRGQHDCLDTITVLVPDLVKHNDVIHRHTS